MKYFQILYITIIIIIGIINCIMRRIFDYLKPFRGT